MVSWLAEMMLDYVFSVTASCSLVSYAQFVGLPSTFLAPLLAEKFKNQRGIVLVIGALMVTGFTGLIFGGPSHLIIVWVTLIGFASVGSISFSLTLLCFRY